MFMHGSAQTSYSLYSQEEVRLEAKSLSRTLLPAHLSAVALCWNEALMKAPVSERVGITSFLIELHSHFPEWQRMSLFAVRTYPLLSFRASLVLSWEVVTEILSELNYTEKHGDAEDGPASAHLVSTSLLVSVLMTYSRV